MRLSVLEKLAVAARDLPPSQARVAQYVIDHAFEAATSPMRSVARDAGALPHTFTRLAKSMGWTGWDELRAEIVSETREGLKGGKDGPYSSRVLSSSTTGLVGAMLQADMAEIARLDTASLVRAAALLEERPQVKVAGFRSSHAPAELFHYLYRLFRPDVALIGGAGGILDLELGSLRMDDAVVLFSFAPYARDALLTARAARGAGCSVLAIVDAAAMPTAAEANQTLVFGTETPSFFPSLTACVALVQALAAILYARSGEDGRARLRQTEARIEAHAAYAKESPDT